jgi:hypothetical protein
MDRHVTDAPSNAPPPGGASGPAERPGTAAQILYEVPDRGMTVAALGSLLVTIYRREYSAEEFEVLRGHELAFARGRDAPIPILTILDVNERHIIRFSRSARERTMELAREIAPYTRCTAVVFDRGGFAASAIRSLVTTVNLFTKQPFPAQVFGDLEAAISWMESKLENRPLELAPATIVASLTALRRVNAASSAP